MDLLQQSAAVLFVIGALAVMVLVARQRGITSFKWPVRSADGVRRMQTLERLVLTPHHSLHLVTVDGRTVLVGVSPGGCQVLEQS